MRVAAYEQTRAAGGQARTALLPAIVRDVLAAPGRPLERHVRRRMESRLRHDFGRVRVHDDSRAAESAVAVAADAYTVGDHVVFAPGRYAPHSASGSRLLVHELSHVVQQRAAGLALPATLAVGRPGDQYECEADRIAGSSAPGLRASLSAVDRPMLQRQSTRGCPNTVDFTSRDPVHVPPCGAFRATTDVRGVTWSLDPARTVVDPGTTIAADGTITIAPTQAAGELQATATGPGGCAAFRSFRVRSHPTGISSTSVVSTAGPPDFGGVFDHVFDSADGNVTSLDSVAVGERFIGVPNPAAATHAITAPTWPFGGTFTLRTATLTPNAGNNWFLTPAGELGGSHDEVTTGRAGINVGRFVRSASNPTPPGSLPAEMALQQGLHWFCPQAAAATRWRMPAFVTVVHSRKLRDSSGAVEFVTTVNGVEIVQTYDGPVAVFGATASPATTSRSSPAPATPAIITVTVSTLPAALAAGAGLRFSLVGNARGCSVVPDPTNDHAAILTVGTSAGPVVVEVADATRTNRDRVTVTVP